jgi:predicted permease
MWSNLLSLFSAGSSDEEFQDEIAAHLESAAADYRASGMSAEEAQRQARLRFGGVTQAREAYREQRGWPLLSSIVADLRFAARQLRRSPGFSVVAVLSLAAGIGATTAIFSLLDSILLRPLPFKEQQSLVKISGFYPKGWIQAVQQRSRSMASVLGYTLSLEHNIETNTGPERVFASAVTTNAFDVLGVQPELGRSFLADEAVAGRDNVVILGDGYWRQRFAANAAVLGQTLRFDGEPRTIIGVMPAGISFPDSSTRMWLPVSFKPGDPIDPWAMFTGQMIGRLRRGVSPQQAQAEMRTLHPQLLKLFPWPMPDNWYADVTVAPLLDSVVEDARPKLFLLFSAVSLVLLITCANVANLMLARAATRDREIAVRSALGATSRRLVRQMLTESLLLGMLAGGSGLLIAMLGLRRLKLLLPPETPRLAESGLHAGSVLFIAGISILTSVAFGLAPAWRLRGLHLRGALKANETSQSSSRERFRLSSCLVAGQVALGVVVLVGAALMLHSLWRLIHVDPGFRTENVVTARVALDSGACDVKGKCANFYRTLLERARRLPGVEQAALVSSLPMNGYDEGFAYDVEGHPRLARQTPDQGSDRTVSPGYFPMLGIQLLRGRLLNDGDAVETSHAMVVNRQMADRYWPGQNPIGKRVEWLGLESVQGVLDDRAFTIVGVVSDTRHESLDSEAGNEMYTPLSPALASAEMSLIVSSKESPDRLAEEIRRLVASVDPAVPVLDVRALSNVVQDSARSQRSLTILLLAFAILALGVGAIGVYSLIAYQVSRKTREIGIRLALGSTRGQLMALVLRQGLFLALTGSVAGLAVSLVLSRWLRSFLFETSPLDPLAFAAAPALLMGLALLAAWVPARRAAAIQPMEALRSE